MTSPLEPPKVAVGCWWPPEQCMHGVPKPARKKPNAPKQKLKIIEWIGDKVLSLTAVRMLEEVGVEETHIRNYAEQLTTNKNLRGGTAIETTVGKCYRAYGFEPALSVAEDFLKTTEFWQHKVLHSNLNL